MELLFTPSMCVSISTAAAHPASTTISPSEKQRMQTWNPEISYSSQRSHMTSALQKMQTSTSHSASALPYQHNSCHSKTSNSNPSSSSFLPTPTSAPFSTAVNMVLLQVQYLGCIEHRLATLELHVCHKSCTRHQILRQNVFLCLTFCPQNQLIKCIKN